MLMASMMFPVVVLCFVVAGVYALVAYLVVAVVNSPNVALYIFENTYLLMTMFTVAWQFA
jgi:hypothetical protein